MIEVELEEKLAKLDTPLRGSEARELMKELNGLLSPDDRIFSMTMIRGAAGMWKVNEIKNPVFVDVGDGRRIAV